MTVVRGTPPVRDRGVQTVLRRVIEPIFEHRFAEHSAGVRPGRGGKDALRRGQTLLGEGHTWIVDADPKGCFDRIPQDRLMSGVEERIADSRVLALIRSDPDQGVMDGLTRHEPADRGTPQGAVISPRWANICPDPLDPLVSRERRGEGALRRRLRAAVGECRGGAGRAGPGANLGR